MGFFDSLGIQFVDGFEDDVEELIEDKPQSKSDSAPKSNPSSSKLSNYTKEDLIVFLMLLMLGAAGGFGYAKLLQRKEPSSYQPHEVHHHHYPDRDKEVKEAPKHSRAVEHHPTKPKKADTRHGYYLDENQDAILDEPRVLENWVIHRDFNGDLIDAYKIPDADTVV